MSKKAKQIKINWLLLFAFILVSQLAGVLGTLSTGSEIQTWYAVINKPFFSPPNWIFGPVWITLYTLMGVGAYLVWRSKKSKYRRVATFLFTSQLITNTLWTPIFFGLKQLDIALFVILFLLIQIIFMTINFYKVSKNAAYMQIPYICWVSFASLLNFAIWKLN